MSIDPSRKTIVAPGGPGFEGFGEALGEVLTGMITGIGDAISNGLDGLLSGGLFGVVESAVKDGQFELNQRTDLLSPLLDYCSVTMPSGQPFVGTGPMPFSVQIGPSRGAEKFVSGSISGVRLLDKGLWNIDLQATASWVALLNGKTQVDVRVYRPDGSQYAQQSSLDSRAFSQLGVTTSGESTHNIRMSVVVPEAGYYVQVFVSVNASSRKFLGGPQWSRLTAQHISRDTAGTWDTGAENSDTPE